MRHSRLAALSLMLVVLAVPSHAAGVRHRNVELKSGIADITGSISGDRSIEYEFSSPGAQVVGIGLKTRHKMAYFDLLPAGSEDPIFNGSVSGRNFLGELPAAGLYRVRVYLMRDAAHRQESASYTLSISLRDSNKPGAGSEAAAAAAPAAVANDGAPRGATGEGRAPTTDRGARVQVPFDQSIAMQGVTFRVQSPNAGVPNKVLITPEEMARTRGTFVKRSKKGSLLWFLPVSSASRISYRGGRVTRSRTREAVLNLGQGQKFIRNRKSREAALASGAVPMFVLKREVKLGKRLDIDRAVESAAARLEADIGSDPR